MASRRSRVRTPPAPPYSQTTLLLLGSNVAPPLQRGIPLWLILALVLALGPLLRGERVILSGASRWPLLSDRLRLPQSVGRDAQSKNLSSASRMRRTSTGTVQV